MPRNPTGREDVEVKTLLLKRETAKAVLVRAENIDGDEVEEWVPYSQIRSMRPVDAKVGDEGVVVVMSKWIAEEKKFA